jgi:hypothetical protein
MRSSRAVDEIKRLAVNAKVAGVLGSIIRASSDTVESEGRQMNNVHRKVFPVDIGRMCRKIKKKKHKKSRKEEEGKEETTTSSCAKELTKVVINLRGISTE